jgi:multiple sugar transport system permease protein
VSREPSQRAIAGLIIPHATSAFGIFFLRQAFLAIPRDLEDASRVDRANSLTILRRVIVPLSVPAILTVGLLHFQFNWNDLLWPLVVTPDRSMQTLPAGLASFMGQHISEFGLLMAGATIAMVPVVVLFAFVQRRFQEGIATTGMK